LEERNFSNYISIHPSGWCV